MHTRILIALSIAAGLMNPVAAVISVAEHQKNSEPVMLVLFVLPWLAGAYLIARGKQTAGVIVVGVLSLFELAVAPTWHRHTVADWTSQAVSVVILAACFAGCAALLVQRYRTARPAGALR
jgi:hypothetical protein